MACFYVIQSMSAVGRHTVRIFGQYYVFMTEKSSSWFGWIATTAPLQTLVSMVDFDVITDVYGYAVMFTDVCVDSSSQFSADSQPMSIGLVWGWRPSGAESAFIR